MLTLILTPTHKLKADATRCYQVHYLPAPLKATWSIKIKSITSQTSTLELESPIYGPDKPVSNNITNYYLGQRNKESIGKRKWWTN